MLWASRGKFLIMNSVEIQECINILGTSDGVSMEDYFTTCNQLTGIDIDTLKSNFKSYYPDTTNWSF